MVGWPLPGMDKTDMECYCFLIVNEILCQNITKLWIIIGAMSRKFSEGK